MVGRRDEGVRRREPAPAHSVLRFSQLLTAAPPPLPAMPQLYGPPPGSSCSTVSPDSRKDCCKTKVSETTDDSWCQEKYPEVGRGAVQLRHGGQGGGGRR